MDQPSLVPGQQLGAHSEVTHEVTCADNQSATQLFQLASLRLRNVNEWQQYCDGSGSEFRLFDNEGNEQVRPARVGDHIRIDIPGPGSAAGKGFDWVKVEAINSEVINGGHALSMRVRPTTSPVTDDDAIAHFFDAHATSTFSVNVQDNIVTAAIYGRNEQPNTNASTSDNIRNTVIAIGAIAGLNQPQWKRLAVGFLRQA